MTAIHGFTEAQLNALFNLQNDPPRVQNLLQVLERLGKVQYGTLEVANGVATGTAAVGAANDGKPVFAMLNEVDGVVVVAAAVIAAGTLTVTLSANTTGIRTVAYIILGA